MRSHEQIWSMPQLVVLRKWLLLKNVQNCSGNLSLHESISQMILVNGGTSSNVHEYSCLLHLGEAVGVVEEVVGTYHFGKRPDDEISVIH